MYKESTYADEHNLFLFSRLHNNSVRVPSADNEIIGKQIDNTEHTMDNLDWDHVAKYTISILSATTMKRRNIHSPSHSEENGPESTKEKQIKRQLSLLNHSQYIRRD